jgi:mono/diheme cytochrome c family protein
MLKPSSRALCDWLLAATAMSLCCTMTLCTTALAGDDEDALAAFRREVEPVLKQRCIECHGPDAQEADLRLDTLDPDLISGGDAETWHDVLNKLNLGEMPPEQARPLSQQQREFVVGWLTAELQRAEQVKRSNGGQVVLRRLTRYEYDNTMRDLLGVNLDFARDLPPDPPSPQGFRNNGAVLGISPLQMELYLEAARRGLKEAIVLGEKPLVYTHRAEKSEKVRRVKGEVSNRLGASGRFLARMMEFPRAGEVLVRVRAGGSAPEDAPWPRMRVALGVRADVQAPEKTLGEVDVTAPVDAPQTYEFRGRIEDFPLPGHNPKYPGLQITVYNSSAYDQPKQAKGKKQKKNKKKGQQDAEIDPNEPLVVIESVEFEGPVIASWPPPSHTRILFPSDSADDETKYAREVLQRFLTRAYRRPVKDADVDFLVRHFQRLRPDYATFEETKREVLAMSLISPEFLYLVEPKQNASKRERLSDYELASRLSYFLWSSMPDDRLFELAAAGELHKPEVLAPEVERMLADPKSRQFVRHFTNQWFDLAALDRIAVNPEFHPDFDDRLKADMRRETQLFFAAILDEDLSCLTLLDADFTLVNRPLAEHYGIAGPRGTAHQRVALSPEDRRGGLLAQGSFLLSGSNGEDSHPIKRAVWLLDRLLDDPPPPPPPDVPQLDPDKPDLAGLPLKRQLEIHRRKEACNNCHRGIDPWGVALENFDAVGRWRTEVAPPRKGKNRKAVPVDASAQLPDGTQIEGVEQLKQHLLTQHREQFAQAVVRRLLAFSLGRSLDLSDQPAVESLTRTFAEDDYRLRSLITAIVQSEPFQTK